MTYTAYIERQSGEIKDFPDVRDAFRLPNGDVHVKTREGATLTVPGGDIIRLKHTNETSDS